MYMLLTRYLFLGVYIPFVEVRYHKQNTKNKSKEGALWTFNTSLFLKMYKVETREPFNCRDPKSNILNFYVRT